MPKKTDHLDEETLRARLGWEGPEHRAGGQELILPEVLAALYPASAVLLPFSESCQTLAVVLESLGVKVIRCEGGELAAGAEAMYFGTPTIVDGRAFFGGYSDWDKSAERAWVRNAVATFVYAGGDLIVSGLGTGDISPEERIEDLGGGAVVAYKRFAEFEDWVIKRELI